MEGLVAVGVAALLVLALHSLLRGVGRAETRDRAARSPSERREAE
jgi:hypothetical protein